MSGHCTPGTWFVQHVSQLDTSLSAIMTVTQVGPYYVQAELRKTPADDASDILCCEADARLIAAAPELLAALQAALPRLAHKASCHSARPTDEWPEHGSVSYDKCDCEIRLVRAAIAKASGSPS